MKLHHVSIGLFLFFSAVLAANGQEFGTLSPNDTKSVVPPNILERVLKQADLGGATPYVCVTSVLPPLLRAPYSDPSLQIAPLLVPSAMPKLLPDIETLFNMTERKFGEITVFAPAMMTILSADVPAPNIDADISQQDAFKLLAAMLSDDQWKKLTSDLGLCDDDLSSDKQHELWKAVLRLPEKILLHKEGDIGKPGEGLDVTNKASQFRLHLQRYLYIEIPTSENSYSPGILPDPSKRPQYGIDNGWEQGKSLYGFRPHQEVLNVPKAGNLLYDDAKFDPPVSMSAASDLGTLLLRIGLRTKSEIYCDARMTKFHVVMAPMTGSVRAGDLLKALAFAVTGTYRKVGPAFILTNDLMGIGSKNAILSNFRQKADSFRRKGLGEAGDIISLKHSLWSLPFPDSPGLDLTAEQHKRLEAADPYLAVDPNQGSYYIKISDLTPAQRAQAQSAYDTMIKNPKVFRFGTPSLDGKILLNSSANLRMTIPGVEGEVEFSRIELDNFFEQSYETRNKRSEEIKKAQQEGVKSDIPTILDPDVSVALPLQFAALTPNRAIVSSPGSVDEAKNVVEKAKVLGFNQVWVTIFFPGVNDDVYTSGRLSAKEIDIVHEAARTGAAHGIAVYVYLDLLNWPKNTPTRIRDVDILGEDSAVTLVRQSMEWAREAGQTYSGPSAKDMPVSVSPMDPRVQRVLMSVHKQIEHIDDIAGIVWSHTGGLGYVKDYNDREELGYSDPVRLGYVREAHIDPVDIIPIYGFLEVDTTIPVMQQDYQSTNNLQQNWLKYRASAVEDLLRRLRGQVNPTALPTSTAKTFLVAERSGSYPGWFGSWDALTASMPYYHQNWEDDQPGKFPIDPAKQARMESRNNFASLQFWPLDDYKAMLASGKDLLKMSKWDGVVVYADVVAEQSYAGIHPGDSTKAMDKLIESLTPKPAVPAKLASDQVKKAK